jgi:protocatechuate 3,4-dioxygenase beta subunit
MRLLISTVILSSMAVLIFSRVEQPEYGAISGRVTDETGSPISEARVAARNEARSLTFHASTDSGGNYRISSLPQGRYSVWAEAPKHHSRIVYGVIVNRAEEVQIDMLLQCCTEGEAIPTSVDGPPTLRDLTHPDAQ